MRNIQPKVALKEHCTDKLEYVIYLTILVTLPYTEQANDGEM